MNDVRLVLADDHRMLREGLRRSLEEQGLSVVGEASDGEEAVRLARELEPDIVVMDLSMPVLDGIEATRRIRETTSDTKVVVLTMHGDADMVQRAIRAGAVGYLVKDCTTDEVVATIRAAASGETAVSRELAVAMLAEAQDEMISKREREVLQLVAEGLSTPEVADRLFISIKTVKNHLASIYEKLDAHDRTQAVLRAIRLGIIRLD